MTPKRFEWPAGQLDGERSRLVVEGRRIDDHALCTLVTVHEVGGTWALFPHGWGKFGIRLPHTEAIKIARRILGLEDEHRERTFELLDGILAVALSRHDDDRQIHNYAETIAREVARWAGV